MPKHESQIVRDEHDEAINAKRVSLVSTSTIYAVVNTGAAGDSTAKIGFATVAVSTPTLYAVVNTSAAGDSLNKIGFATVYVSGNVTLSDSKSFIGLTTTVLGSAPTLYAVVNTAAAGQASIVLDNSTSRIGFATVNIANAVSVTGTVDLGATDNAVLDNIDADLTTIIGHVDGLETLLGTIDTNTSNMATSLGSLDNAVDGNYLNVNMNIAGTDVIGGAGVITAQTQRVTIATDDEVNNLLGTIDTDTSNISTKIDTLAGAVAGTEMQVDVATIAAGDNNIGNVDIASIAAGVNSIGFATVVVSNLARTITGNLTLSDPKGFIGLVTVANTARTITGNITLSNPNTYIGLTTTTLGVGDRFIGLVTVGNTARSITGNVTLSDAKTYVGLTTTTLGVGSRFIGLTTSWALNAGTTKTIVPKAIALSASSISTIVVPTGGTTFKTTNLVLNSDATVRVSIKSGVTYLTGNATIGITLNPGGGWVETGSPDSPTYIGLAVDTALVVEKFDMTGTVARISGKINYFLD